MAETMCNRKAEHQSRGESAVNLKLDEGEEPEKQHGSDNERLGQRQWKI